MPGAPSGLGATASTTQIALSWNTASGASSYNVYRGTSAGAEASTPIATGVTGTTYNDAAVSAGSTYYYKVAGVNTAGTGQSSNEAFAQVPSSTTTSNLVAKISKSCGSSTCTFTSSSTDSGGTIQTYSWSGGDGVTGSGSSVKHTYSGPGAWSVSLKVTDNTSASSSTTVSVSCQTYNFWFGQYLICR